MGFGLQFLCNFMLIEKSFASELTNASYDV